MRRVYCQRRGLIERSASPPTDASRHANVEWRAREAKRSRLWHEEEAVGASATHQFLESTTRI